MIQGKQLIAVIDDEKDIIELYKDIFSETFRVQSFLSPLEFLRAIDDQQVPDLVLVISDYKMPKMSGLEMIETLHKKGCLVATLLLSGYIDKDVAVSALNHGINKVLEKPVDADVIYTTAVQLVKEFRLHKVEQQTVALSDQLSELYVLYRNLLVPGQASEPKGVLSIDRSTHQVSSQSPLQLIADLEKQIATLNIEKELLKQGAI